MKQTTVKMTVEITVDDNVTIERFGKTSDKVTMGEYGTLLSEALKEAPFQSCVWTSVGSSGVCQEK